MKCSLTKLRGTYLIRYNNRNELINSNKNLFYRENKNSINEIRVIINNVIDNIIDDVMYNIEKKYNSISCLTKN